MKVFVDQNRCVGAGNCVMTVGEVFDQREEDGVVVLHTDSPPRALLSRVQDAAGRCPATAIRVEP